ncbi:DMT family transporter [Tropicimonas sediminicola]|uniref:Permease of the drug/metabolite transporter (DMT) superfamily n=1 Tax=Tropicimonas sediminicola TaxID=1031541 RepID=A0A239C8N0_9RHOB|nr:EamA family transporter [Tropicimonas sediminicola]SNS15733.1 Permease of the drug/metabolite transporter (DMT) superfamily [Tropicimonas sediminicola]
MTRANATAIGFVAVLLWALLALFTVGSAPVPPLQLTAMSFAIGGAIGVVWTLAAGGLHRLRGVSWKVYAFGTTGLFGYHLFYFSALRLAPPAQAGLIAYLWPLLIVLMSGLLPGERLRAGHLLGGALGFAGAALIILGDGAGLSGTALPGYGMALLCAFFWSGYSVLSRRIGDAPTETVAVFCLATALLSGMAHLALEETVLPATPLAWASVIALGLGPVGLAFYVWDIGVKRGDIQLLGVASYAAPLLSTLALVLAGLAAPTPKLLVAAALITGGAVLAAMASRRADKDVTQRSAA